MPTVIPNFAPAVEAFTRGFVEAGRERQQREQRAAQILYEGAKADPTLFDSPVVQKQLKALGLEKDEYELVAAGWKAKAAAADPETQAGKMLALLPGGLTPEEQAAGGVGAAAQQAQQQPAAYTPYTVPQGAPAPTPAPGVFPAIARTLGVGGMTEAPSLPIEPTAPAPKPYTGSMAALVQRAPRIPGATVKINSKGGVEVSIRGKTAQQAEEAQVYRAIAIRQRELHDMGTDDPTDALKQSITEMVDKADEAGLAVPKDVRAIRNTDITNIGKVELRNMQKQVDEHYAGPLAQASGAGRTKGTAQAKEELPIPAKEASLWFDPATGQPLPSINPETGQPVTLGEARVKGVRVNQEAVKVHNALAGAEGYLAQWKDAAGALFPKGDESFANLINRTGTYQLAKYTRGTVGGLTDEQKDAVTTIQEAQNNVLLLLRGVGEKGNIAARLVDKASKTGPGFYETNRSATSRLNFFAGLIAATRAASGLPLSPGERSLLSRVPDEGVAAGLPAGEIQSALDKLLGNAPPQPPQPKGAGAPAAPSTGDADLDKLIGITP